MSPHPSRIPRLGDGLRSAGRGRHKRLRSTVTTITEAALEQAAVEWLRGQGWRTLHGPDIGPGTPAAERADYGHVVLERRLRDALAKLNPVRRSAKSPIKTVFIGFSECRSGGLGSNGTESTVSDRRQRGF